MGTLQEKNCFYFLSASELIEKNSAINSLLLLPDLFFFLLHFYISIGTFRGRFRGVLIVSGSVQNNLLA